MMNNIYARIPEGFREEMFEDILHGGAFKLKRVVSQGQATALGQWYDQDRDEWVVLLSGSAGIRVEGQEEVMVLKPGDYVHLPAHQKHRVEWTDAKAATVWLAIYYQPDN
jgi:cupin 2 domain-containing protein